MPTFIQTDARDDLTLNRILDWCYERYGPPDIYGGPWAYLSARDDKNLEYYLIVLDTKQEGNLFLLTWKPDVTLYSHGMEALFPLWELDRY